MPPDHDGELRSWRLVLPYTSPPLTMNRQLHHHARASAVRHLRRAAEVLARQQRIPALPRISVELHYVPVASRRRDPINLAPSAKACEDGIVDAGVVPDDTPDFVQPCPAVIWPSSGRRLPPGMDRLFVVVRELPPPVTVGAGPVRPAAGRCAGVVTVVSAVIDVLVEHPVRLLAVAAAVTLLAAAALIAIPPAIEAQMVEVADV